LLSIPSEGRGARRPLGQSFRKSVGLRPRKPFIQLENFGIFRHFLMMDAHKLLMSLV